MYDKNTVHVHITHGDVTTANGVKSTTILTKLGGIVNEYKKSYHLIKTHFQEIVHIVDMDGAYIPDTAVVEDISAKKAIYSLTEIRTACVQGIINRNRTKSACINKISSTSTLCGIPYQAYYMSCNLDHVLYDKLNSTDDEKEKDALDFAKEYGSKVPDFIKFMAESDFSVGENYLESWAFIKKDKHSLERHTNLGICIARAIEGQNISKNS
jgi:hypothetical protein